MPSDALMYMNWQQMIKPDKVQVTSNPMYGKFVCEPLERGYGVTMAIACAGSSSRRFMGRRSRLSNSRE